MIGLPVLPDKQIVLEDLLNPGMSPQCWFKPLPLMSLANLHPQVGHPEAPLIPLCLCHLVDPWLNLEQLIQVEPQSTDPNTKAFYQDLHHHLIQVVPDFPKNWMMKEHIWFRIIFLYVTSCFLIVKCF